MNGVDVVVDIAKEALYTIISVALPVLLVSLIVGLISIIICNGFIRIRFKTEVC